MRSIKVVATGACALAALVVGGGIAAAQDVSAPPPAPAAASTITLPLFGTPLIIDVTTDAGGGLVDVTLNQADEYSVTKIKPNRVKFVNTDGTVSVAISARHGGQRVEARAGQLADISGPGIWTGDVFETGDATTVNFVVGAGADGGPDITGVTVDSVADFVIGETHRETQSGDDGDDEGDDEGDDNETEQSASVTIEFSHNDQTRSLRVKATLETDDGETSAKLTVSLSRLRGSQLAEGPAAGPHTWSGQLCDGTAAELSYVVGADGQISDVVSNVPAEVDTHGHEARIRFSDHERISIVVEGEATAMTVGVSTRIRCDRVNPTVNGAPVSIPDDGDEGDDDHVGKHDGDDQGDDDSADDPGDDDTDHSSADDENDDEHDDEHDDSD